MTHDGGPLVNALTNLVGCLRMQSDNHVDAMQGHFDRQQALENLVGRLAANTRADLDRIPSFSGYRPKT